MIRRPPRSTLFPYRRSSDLTGTRAARRAIPSRAQPTSHGRQDERSEEHTSELQSPCNLVCRLLLEKKKTDLDTHDRIQSRAPLALSEDDILFLKIRRACIAT